MDMSASVRSTAALGRATSPQQFDGRSKLRCILGRADMETRLTDAEVGQNDLGRVPDDNRRCRQHELPTKVRNRRSRLRSGAVAENRHFSRCSLLSVDEAAQYLGISSGTMRNWLSMRRIEHVKVGRLTRISQAVLERYVATHTVRAEAEE